MAHDLVAELIGYRNERVVAERAGRADRVESIDVEIGRLTDVVTRQAEQLETSAAALADAGQDTNAATLRAQAKQLREALGTVATQASEPDGEDQDAGGGAGATETAQDSTPRERAVPRKGGKA